MEKRTEWGQTVVHDDVLAVIAARAALTVPGVVQMSQHGLGDNLTHLVRHENGSRGVKVTPLEDAHYTIDLHLIVVYGARLSEVGKQVAQAVNTALNDAVGLYPDQLVIHIDGVRAVDE